MKLAELVGHWVSVCIPDCEILSLHNDSRQIKPGSLFLAYPGLTSDGRLFIRQAIRAGAAAIVYEPERLPISCLSNQVPCLPIPGLKQQIAAIANLFYGDPSRTLPVTGITGTNGKTTIAYQLAQAYELLGQRAAYIGTLGQGEPHSLRPLLNTTPDPLCLQHLLHEYQQNGLQQVCMEVSSHALTQKRVDNIEFAHAIYTNLSHEHLDYHHTMQAYAAAKAELFSNPSLKSALFNEDDEFAPLMSASLPKTCEKLTYGLQVDGDVRGLNWRMSMFGCEFDVVSPWGRHHLCINTLGMFNIYNSLAVFASLLLHGFGAGEASSVMAKLQAVPGRMEVVATEPCVIVDYAHTPDALKHVLSAVKQLKQARVGVVFGCGGDRDKEKRPLMGRIASEYADFVIITNDNPRTEEPSLIMNDIALGLNPEAQVLKIPERKKAIHKAISLADKQDIIVIAGKGHEAYQHIGQERYVFSDQDVVRQGLINTNKA